MHSERLCVRVSMVATPTPAAVKLFQQTQPEIRTQSGTVVFGVWVWTAKRFLPFGGVWDFLFSPTKCSSQALLCLHGGLHTVAVCPFHLRTKPSQWAVIYRAPEHWLAPDFQAFLSRCLPAEIPEELVFLGKGVACFKFPNKSATIRCFNGWRACVKQAGIPAHLRITLCAALGLAFKADSSLRALADFIATSTKFAVPIAAILPVPAVCLPPPRCPKRPRIETPPKDVDIAFMSEWQEEASSPDAYFAKDAHGDWVDWRGGNLYL